MKILQNSFWRSLILSLALFMFPLSATLPLSFAYASASSIGVWWPSNGAHMSGTQPFKAMVPGLDVSQYEMFWQVDGGAWNWMDNNYTDYQHKEASVGLSSWSWHGSGPYIINFIVRQNGTVIAQQSETIYIDNGMPVTVAQPAPVAQTSPTTPVSAAQNTPPTTQNTPSTTQNIITASVNVSAPVTPISATNSPNGSMKLYIDPNSNAAKQASLWATSSPTGAFAMKILASQPTAVWFGDWNSNIGNDVHTLVSNAQAQGAVPVMIAYNIPERDCGGFSAGGTNNPAGYQAWVNSFAQGLGSAPATVVLEPDAVAQIGCLSAADQQTRLGLLSGAVQTLKRDANAKVYLDAGHSGWIDASVMAANLQKAGIAQADGFSLNVSNFMANSDEINYGSQVSSKLNGKHFIIDTARNGNGSDGQWCNPSGRAIGTKPTTQTGNTLVDGFLWLKTPGESDGACNGGPSAGVWWPEYAQGLITNAHY